MSDGWQVGDLALCVDDKPAVRNIRCSLKKGAIYRVEGIGVCRSLIWPELNGLSTLFLHGVPLSTCGNGKLSSRFRKIKPDAHDACEAEFVTLIKRAPQKVSA